MIQCEECGKSHRDVLGVERCQGRAARKREREAKKAQEAHRRAENWEKEHPADYIKRRRQEGAIWEHIVSGLNKDYPPPEFADKWDLMEVVGLDTQRMYPWAPVEEMTLLRIQRHYLGEWVGLHPMEIAVIADWADSQGAVPISRLTGERKVLLDGDSDSSA